MQGIVKMSIMKSARSENGTKNRTIFFHLFVIKSSGFFCNLFDWLVQNVPLQNGPVLIAWSSAELTEAAEHHDGLLGPKLLFSLCEKF